MTVYNSLAVSNKAPIVSHGENHQVQAAHFTINTTAVLTTADTFNFGKLPANARLVGGYMNCTDLDASTGLTINVGDSGSATRLFNASTLGQAGGAALIPAAALDFQYTTETMITGSISNNATTTASGTIILVLLYYVEE